MTWAAIIAFLVLGFVGPITFAAAKEKKDLRAAYEQACRKAATPKFKEEKAKAICECNSRNLEKKKIESAEYGALISIYDKTSKAQKMDGDDPNEALFEMESDIAAACLKDQKYEMPAGDQ